jgi:hypothetical protein
MQDRVTLAGAPAEAMLVMSHAAKEASNRSGSASESECAYRLLLLLILLLLAETRTLSDAVQGPHRDRLFTGTVRTKRDLQSSQSQKKKE